ncbi:murein biosynthesis integral membrane protein MurJ [Curtobacterium sp. MCJR17_043]|uniref:murein biosynthesis integral membrane protein MurJ n=1 Tax=Curtobacterium sp. MCJR17_043 TaxID=2175660 RepID=UPI0024DF448A|nr:murein biosynthesis integral membrane protein MurJ [Curtobacterium sp. MCJR17_043]WIB36085.1 murein biosynthesis integral membrane protein MurJ [Curtobacterium sp. MCJR17_043]
MAADGDRLEDAIMRAGVQSSLPADHHDDDSTRDDRRQPTDRRASEEPTISTTPPTTTGNVDTAAEGGRDLGRASALLAVGTMVSRLLGFAKTFVLAYAIGQANSRAADAFAVSNQLPNNIYALIAGGLLSAVLIPQIVRSMSQNGDGGRAYVNKIVTLGGSVFVVITVIATLLAPVLVRVYAAQADDGKGFSPAATDLAVAFAFWCLPQILFYAMYSLLGEVLNAKQVFGPFTWAPLINNVIAIAGLVVFIALFGNRTMNAGTEDWTPLKIAVLAGSASLGVLAQAAFLPFFWKRAGLTFRPDFRWRGVGLKATGTAAGWLFAMILVTQLAGIVQSRVASLGSGNAGNAVLQNAWLLFMLPHSIIAVSIATAYFTRMSHDAERGDLAAVRRNLSLSLRIVGLFTVFSAVALMVVAVPFGRMFSNTFEGAVSIGGVLLAYMPGLVLFSMLFIIQRVFWAMHDHRTPFLMQLVQSGLFVIGALAVTALPGQVIGLAVAACTTVAGSAQTIVALVLVRRRLDGIEGPVVTRSHLQFVVAALVAGAVGLVVVHFFGAFRQDGFAMADFTSAAITVVLGGVVMVAVYFGVLAAIRNAEVRSAVDLVRARLGR